MKSQDQQMLEEAYELIQLNELFDSPFPYENLGTTGHERASSYTRYSFSTTDKPFPRILVLFTLDAQDPSLEILFTHQEDPSSRAVMDLTGTGNGSRVMGTVMDITKKYLQKDLKASQFEALQHGEIKFSAKMADRGRVKLYDTLANLLVRSLDQMCKQNDVQWKWVGSTDEYEKVYTITAKKKSSRTSKQEKPTKSSLQKFLTK